MIALTPLRLAIVALWCAMTGLGAEPPATFSAQLSLVRYDLPRGRSDGYAPTRQKAVKQEGPVGVDWPDFTFNGMPVFRGRAEEVVTVKLRRGNEASSPFRVDADDAIEPGGHWFRGMEWLQGKYHLYTADKTARCGASAAEAVGKYELWTFPIRIEGQGAPIVKNVVLKSEGVVVYNKPGPWRSLTLLLPASALGESYELTIDGRGPVKFQAGLQPVKLGDPRELVFPVEAALAGDGPKVTIRHLSRPDEFPNPKEWEADVAALALPRPADPVSEEEGKSLRRYLGVEVPRSPLLIYGMALSYGKSGGFYAQGSRGFHGTMEEYAKHLAGMGFDAVFDQANALPAPDAPESFERRALALAREGVKLGLQYDNNWTRPSLQHPNVAFFAHTLPEWHAPLYRSLQLVAQRFARCRNFLGIDIGADNAGYVSYWNWAPPNPNRPWGEAMVEFMGTPEPQVARAPSLVPREATFEKTVQSQGEFAKYVDRYETSFRQYGYFAEAVREIDPQLVFTMGSFGSAPGTGGRGGWPWASLPGRVMFEGVTVQQTYDWNETHAAKPLHNLALVDRMESYYPAKKTWALLDNYQLLYGRESYQRAVALLLSRGIQGLGTNFLPGTDGDGARADAVTFETEMNAWVRKYGGAYARMQPTPTIGIFYGHHQAVQRRIVTGEKPKEEDLYAGSHEGKVTEALFLCHAAGWPARVITYQEIMRGGLPSSMKAILLVGLDQPDETWTWSPGLEPQFKKFLARGGRIIADDESVCPVPFTKTEMRVAAYVAQSNVDATPLLFARNAGNIAMLREAMDGVAEPVAVSESPSLWAVPGESGTTQYVTVVNQAVADGDEAQEYLRAVAPRAVKPEVWKTKANASLYVKPQVGVLKWNTERPIYDVRLGRKITADEAEKVDLTADAFRLYALPAAELVEPTATVTVGVSGFYEAKVEMLNGVELSGVPVEIVVGRGEDSATIYGATGQTVRLPINEGRESGDFTIEVKELLSGLKTTVALHSDVPPGKPAAAKAARLDEPLALARFAARKRVALTIALTPEQEKDAKVQAQAKALAAFYQKAGRPVTMGRVAPGGVVESLQPLRSPNRYPQWKTIPADLVLFGTPSNNVLLLDQARAEIFPSGPAAPAAGRAAVVYTRSPFVGEYDVVNVIAADAGGITAAVQALTALH